VIEDVGFLGHFFPTSSPILSPHLNRVGLWVEKKSFSLPNMESYLDINLSVAPMVLIASEDVWFLSLFFPIPGLVQGPRLNGVGLLVEKQSSPLPNMESYLDTHLRVAPIILIASEDVWFLGRFFPTPSPVLGEHLNGVGLWVEKKISPIPNMEPYLDTYLRVAPMVLIASEDVWFLGRIFPTPCPVLGPHLNEVGLWVENQGSPLPNVESYFDTHLRVALVVLIVSEDVWFLGHIFPTLGPILGLHLNRAGLWVEKKSSPLPNMESYLDTHLSVAPIVLIASEDVWFLGYFFSPPGPVLGPRLNGVGLCMEKKSSPLPNMESYLDTHFRVAPVVLIASEDVWLLGHFFSTPGPVLGPRLNGVGLWVEKKSSLLPNMESYLDTHLRVVRVVLIASEYVWFLGHFFSTLGDVLGPCLNKVGLLVENKSSPLPNMESYLDTHLRVACVVLIVSKDVWFLGHFFSTLCPILGPRLNGVGIWVEKQSSPLSNMESYLDTHLRVARVVLIARKYLWFLGHVFSTLGHVLGPRLNGVGLWVEKQSCLLQNMESYLDSHLRVAPVVRAKTFGSWASFSQLRVPF
jgi:hypothetical protein